MEKSNENKINYLNKNIGTNKAKKKEDKINIVFNLIKKDIHSFISKSTKKGFSFNIKLNEKTKKIKLFITLLNNSDTNNRIEDIDFLILVNEEYPEKAPMVFSMSCVKLIFIINI